MKKTNKKLVVTIILISTVLIGAIGIISFISHKNFSDKATNISSQTELATQLASKKTTKTIENVPSKSSVTQKSKSPVINSKDITIKQGDAFNALQDVTAKDASDKDITKNIKTDGTVDTNTPGTYEVKLSVKDNDGNETTAVRTVTVEKNEETISSTTLPSSDNSVDASVQVPENTQTTDTQSTTSSSIQTAQVEPATQPVTATTQSVATTPSYSAMSMYIAGQTIPYQNGGQTYGQSIIDSNPNSMISTWGGAATQSGTDGQNTHFIGHNPGVFSAVFNVTNGDQIVVTDGNGTPTTYTVSSIFQVDHYAVGINDGVNYWDTITGTGGGERITLQACVNDTVNIIVIAYA